jgi:hypothetical protein
MAECSIGDRFTIQNGAGITVENITTGVNHVKDICTANSILDKLHNDFTEEYSPDSGTALPGRPIRIANADTGKPTFWLREQPIRASFTFGNGDYAQESGTLVNRFNSIFVSNKTDENQSYRTLIHAIMTGVYNPNISKNDYLNRPSTASAPLTALTTPAAFKGIYGLRDLNKILEDRIKAKVSEISTPVTTDNQLNEAYKYQKRKGIQTTIEEIAYQENKLYREKFLNILLLIVGVFFITTQLTQNYFSFSESSSMSGLGNIGGWLSSRIGFGSGGLFSRFGGIGLGSSGRSRLGNLFTGNPYTLSKRE